MRRYLRPGYRACRFRDHELRPRAVATPGVVFRHLNKKMNCCTCAPVAVTAIYAAMDKLAKDTRVCPFVGRSPRQARAPRRAARAAPASHRCCEPQRPSKTCRAPRGVRNSLNSAALSFRVLQHALRHSSNRRLTSSRAAEYQVAAESLLPVDSVLRRRRPSITQNRSNGPVVSAVYRTMAPKADIAAKSAFREKWQQASYLSHQFDIAGRRR